MFTKESPLPIAVFDDLSIQPRLGMVNHPSRLHELPVFLPLLSASSGLWDKNPPFYSTPKVELLGSLGL